MLRSRDFDEPTVEFLTKYRLHGISALDIGARYLPEHGAGLFKGLQRFGIEDYTILEVYPPNVEELQRQGYNVVLGDVRLINRIFPVDSFDLVCWVHGIEHLNNFAEIYSTVRKLCRVTRRFLLLSFPIGKEKQGSVDGNPYEVHNYFIMDVRKILSCFKRQDTVHFTVYPRARGKTKFWPNAVILYDKRAKVRPSSQ